MKTLRKARNDKHKIQISGYSERRSIREVMQV